MKKQENDEKLMLDNKKTKESGDSLVSAEQKKRLVLFEDKPQDVEMPEELVQKKLEEVMSSQKPHRKKKSTIISLILLSINIIFMVIIVRGLVSGIDNQTFGSYIRQQGNKLLWLLGGVGCYIVYIFAQTLMFHALIRKTTGESKWGLAYNVGIIGKYYDNVTPFAVGGQPMQIVTLSKSGISPGVSTSLPLIKMIINSIF